MIDKDESLWICLSELKDKYRLGILSDCPMEKVEIIKRTISLSLFEKIIFSGEVHTDKNMGEFFEFAAQEFGVNKEEILFVDDSQKNIDFANNLGLQIHCFKSTEHFFVKIQ